MTPNNGFVQFVKNYRIKFTCSEKTIRIVYRTDIIKSVDGKEICNYIAEKTPLFYRKIERLVDELREGYFFNPLKETLARLPTSEHFQSSHFGEIAAGIFSEEVLGFKIIYSKLSLNTAENDNPRKMDLVMYKPKTDPVQFILGEVKSSPKDSSEGLPAGHDKSCYSDIFRSFNKYSDSDRDFDLAAIKDNLDSLKEDSEKIRKSLLPYSNKDVGYIAFAVIDSSTYLDEEVKVLASRKNDKEFNVELLAIEQYKDVSQSVYNICRKIKDDLP